MNKTIFDPNPPSDPLLEARGWALALAKKMARARYSGESPENYRPEISVLKLIMVEICTMTETQIKTAILTHIGNKKRIDLWQDYQKGAEDWFNVQYNFELRQSEGQSRRQ